MRMRHYFLALALLIAPALLATLASGAFHDGGERHLVLGLVTSIGCVALNTLLILFMIVTGRVLKSAMQSRPLAPAFLAELNEFFAHQKAYPAAVLCAFAAVAAAVLGYGGKIGVPIAIHVLVGLVAVVANLHSISLGWRTLRGNQALLDRVAAELDRLDAEREEMGIPPAEAPPIDWRVSERTRWLIYAASAWGPYLYWSLVVWRGEFARVPAWLPIGCGIGMLVGLAKAARAHLAQG